MLLLSIVESVVVVVVVVVRGCVLLLCYCYTFIIVSDILSDILKFLNLKSSCNGVPGKAFDIR